MRPRSALHHHSSERQSIHAQSQSCSRASEWRRLLPIRLQLFRDRFVGSSIRSFRSGYHLPARGSTLLVYFVFGGLMAGPDTVTAPSFTAKLRNADGIFRLPITYRVITM